MGILRLGVGIGGWNGMLGRAAVMGREGQAEAQQQLEDGCLYLHYVAGSCVGYISLYLPPLL